MARPDDKAILVGISGVTTSGKTTISRLLRDIFPNTFILHQDDFYRPAAEIPTTDGFTDWDCHGAIDIPALDAALMYIRAEGSPPPTLESKEDQNTVGPVPVRPEKVAELRARVRTWLSSFGASPLVGRSPICILDGFLLYAAPFHPSTTRHLHGRLFLLASRESALGRRRARDGYVTLEGFWADPPGYAERVVWPNYARAHAWLFADGDVDSGVLDRGVLAREGISTPPNGPGRVNDGNDGAGLETVLEWAVCEIMAVIERVARARAAMAAAEAEAAVAA